MSDAGFASPASIHFMRDAAVLAFAVALFGFVITLPASSRGAPDAVPSTGVRDRRDGARAAALLAAGPRHRRRTHVGTCRDPTTIFMGVLDGAAHTIASSRRAAPLPSRRRPASASRRGGSRTTERQRHGAGVTAASSALERRQLEASAASCVMLRPAKTAPAHRIDYSWADYLALEASSNVKHEYLDGQIYGMAGGTPEHAALAAAVIGLLFGQLRGGRFRAHDADLRVRVRETGLATYPDVTLVCGPRELDPDDKNGVTNPSVIIEVLSRSTEEYDRGDKFEHYKRVPSLKQYVLVGHREQAIEVWTRDAANGWTQRVSRPGERATLEAVGAHLDVRELYDAAAEAAV